MLKLRLAVIVDSRLVAEETSKEEARLEVRRSGKSKTTGPCRRCARGCKPLFGREMNGMDWVTGLNGQNKVVVKVSAAAAILAVSAASQPDLFAATWTLQNMIPRKQY